MRTINREIVSALIFSKDGKLFQGIADPLGGAVWPDCWRIPGGGIEEGEDPVEALVREVQEEIGLDISNSKIELIDGDGSGEGEKTLQDTGETVLVKMNFAVYKVTLDTSAHEVALTLDPHEFVEYRWVDLADLKNLKLTPPSVTLFKRLGWI